MKQKYPWDEWMRGDVIEVEEGVDYVCSRSSFITMLRHKANSAYTRVSIENQVGQTLRFRFGEQPDFPRRPPTNRRKSGPKEEPSYRWYKGEKIYD